MKKKLKPFVAKMSEARILQLSNDLSEDIESGTVEEWRAVALYFRKQVDAHQIALSELQFMSAVEMVETFGGSMIPTNKRY